MLAVVNKEVQLDLDVVPTMHVKHCAVQKNAVTFAELCMQSTCLALVLQQCLELFVITNHDRGQTEANCNQQANCTCSECCTVSMQSMTYLAIHDCSVQNKPYLLRVLYPELAFSLQLLLVEG